MGAKAYNVHLSHSGLENSEKTRREQEGGRELKQRRVARFRLVAYLTSR